MPVSEHDDLGSIAISRLRGWTGGRFRRVSEQVVDAELGFGDAVLCVMGVLGRDMYPFVQDHARHGVRHLALTLVASQSQGVLTQELADSLAVNMNEWLNLSVLGEHPTQWSGSGDGMEEIGLRS